MKRTLALLGALALLTACAGREPEGLALVRVLGADRGGGLTLTAVCGGMDQEDPSRGAACGADFAAARAALPWSGAGVELSLTSVSYLVVSPQVDLKALLWAVLEDADLGAAITLWLAPDGAQTLLAACSDPAADLELLLRRGTAAPTAAQAAAALADRGRVELPVLAAEQGVVTQQGRFVWSGND